MLQTDQCCARHVLRIPYGRCIPPSVPFMQWGCLGLAKATCESGSLRLGPRSGDSQTPTGAMTDRIRFLEAENLKQMEHVIQQVHIGGIGHMIYPFSTAITTPPKKG